MIVNGSNLSMMRGDSDSLTVTLEGRPFAEGDVVTLTVAYDMAVPAPVLQKKVTVFPDGEALLAFAPEDTASIIPGDYIYDVQLAAADVGVKTIVEPSTFTLRGDVTRG